MRLTHKSCIKMALGMALVMLGLAVPPTVGIGAVHGHGSRGESPDRGVQVAERDRPPAQAAMQARWRQGAMLP